MHGLGFLTQPDGTTYRGNFSRDEKHGYGEHYWDPPTRWYKGYWHNGTQSGLGTYLSGSNPQERKGMWQEGKRKTWLEEPEIHMIEQK